MALSLPWHWGQECESCSFSERGCRMAQQNRKPEKVFRIGFVYGSVFARDIDADDGKRTIRNVSLQKQYKDGDETKYAS